LHILPELPYRRKTDFVHGRIFSIFGLRPTKYQFSGKHGILAVQAAIVVEVAKGELGAFVGVTERPFHSDEV